MDHHGNIHQFFIGHWTLGFSQLFQDEFPPDTFGHTLFCLGARPCLQDTGFTIDVVSLQLAQHCINMLHFCI